MRTYFGIYRRTEEERKRLLEGLAEGQFGTDPTKGYDMGTGRSWTDRLRMIYISAMQVDRAIYFSTMITVAAFIPLFTMQGVEGQIFGPMARTYGYALAGALIATFTVTPVLASFLLPDQVKETRNDRGEGAARSLHPGPALGACQPENRRRSRTHVSGGGRLFWSRGWAPSSFRPSRKAISIFMQRCPRQYRLKRPCRR